MLIVLSPAKTLDFETQASTKKHTFPAFLDDSAELIEQLQDLKPDRLGKIMGISPNLATLNSNRYHQWTLPFDLNNSKQAVLAFKGDVYLGLDAESLRKEELDYAQKHLRILSGLYGVLRPLDLIQPYRLEMGTKFKNHRGKNLYEFWDKTITDSIKKDLKKQKDGILINLASSEYFKSIKQKQLDARIITPVFKDLTNGEYKLISFFAKKARGLMSRYIIQNKLNHPEDIMEFNLEGYRFNKALKRDDEWVFTRDNPEN